MKNQIMFINMKFSLSFMMILFTYISNSSLSAQIFDEYFDSLDSTHYLIGDTSRSNNCSNTCDMFSNRSRYTPNTNTAIKEIKVIFVVVQYSVNDKRNFDINDNQHVQHFNNMLSDVNYRFSNLDIASCGGTIIDSKIRFVLEDIITYTDSYSWNNDNYDTSAIYSALNGRNHFLNNYSFTRNDAIYVFWTESECWYNEVVLNGSTCSPSTLPKMISASMQPSINMSNRIVVHMRNYFTMWSAMHNGYFCDTYTPLCCPVCPPSWIGGGAQLAHEFGHFLWSDGVHTTTCNNIMDDHFATLHNYLTTNQLSSFHRATSLLNVRNYVNCNYSSNDPLTVNTSENWDLDINIVQRYYNQ